VPFDSVQPLFSYGFGLKLAALDVPAPVPAQVPSWTKAQAELPRGYSTSRTPIADLMANPAAREIITRHLPAVVNSVNIERMGGITLRRLQGMAPQMVSEATLSAIDAELARVTPPK
jgi:hypothetical protein